MANSEIPNDKRDFRCDHCNGVILIPRELPPTTGPCPHCAGVITSPPLKIPEAPARPAPPSLRPATPEPPPTPARQDPPPVATPPAAAVVPKPPVQVPQASAPSKHDGNRIQPEPLKNKPHKSGLIPVMLVLLVLILGAGAGVLFVAREMGNHIAPPSTVKAGTAPSVIEANYIRIGWQKEAYQVLRDYMVATTSEGKLPHILHGDAFATRLEDFYGGGVINDSDTPAEAFSIYELSEQDRKRGLFMMIYDQPPQFEMKEFFRPLASLEVQYGIDEADLLLSTLARVGNFAMEPLRVHAFFKRTPEGLKLDWEIFAQTKYRTFQNFVELPEADMTGVFRVLIVEDVPDKSHLQAGTRTYRMADPANTTDTARVNVRIDSEAGRTLSVINWRGTKNSQPVTRTATVELTWTGENPTPELKISRFICWEFLGLGGTETPATASTE